MGDESLASTPDLEIWDRLLNEQTVLFRKTTEQNTELRARVEELERELSVWKAAFKTSEEEKKALNRNVLKLERNIGSLREDNPLVLCLIDGDGNIFSPDLITRGQAGGRQAAMLLTKGLMDHLTSINNSETAHGRGQLWLTIYCNKSGLLETLIQNDVCSTEQFETFVVGFNQASPLFSIMDVGTGKEAADAKIKECLRVFTRFPQILKVFFGGAHDNGYSSTLNLLQNEGLLDKIVLLQGYKDLAYELRSFGLPPVEIPGVFMTKKLHTSPFRKASGSIFTQTSPIQQQDFENFRSKAVTPAASHRSSSPTKILKHLDPNQPLHKQKPPPCNFYYLAECKHGQNCRYGHDYELSSEQLLELREAAWRWPCPAVNRDHPCHLGDNCCMGHVCPKGPRCSFAKQGRCKFLGKNMHTRSGFSGEDSQPKNSVSPVQGMSGLHMSPLTSNSNTIHLHNHDKNAMSPHDIMISSGPLQWPGISKGPIAQSYTTTNSNNNAERSWSRIHNADGFFPGY